MKREILKLFSFREESTDRLLSVSESSRRVVHIFPNSHIVVTTDGSADPVSLSSAWLISADMCRVVSTHWLVCLDTHSLALRSLDLRTPTAFKMHTHKVSLLSNAASIMLLLLVWHFRSSAFLAAGLASI